MCNKRQIKHMAFNTDALVWLKTIKIVEQNTDKDVTSKLNIL